MKLSIIVRCLNEEKYIGKLLEGIYNQKFSQDYEVIVVDSGSTDSTLEIVGQYNLIKIVHINPEDFSFGYALNRGCEIASGEILLFASAHVYPLYHDWFQEMTIPFRDELVALVYGKQEGDHVSKYSELQIFHRWFPSESNSNQEHAFCNNANCAVRKKLWETQKYDETLTGLEDLEWAKQVKEKNLKIYYNSNATIVHVHEESYSRIYNRYRREAIAMKKIYPNLKFSLLQFMFLLATNISTDYIHAIKDGKFVKNILEIPAFRFCQLYGTFRGYQNKGEVEEALKRRFYYPNSKIRGKISSEESERNLIVYKDKK